MSQTTRNLFFESVGTGYGRELPTGTPVTVTEGGPNELFASHVDGAREYRAPVTQDDYR